MSVGSRLVAAFVAVALVAAPGVASAADTPDPAGWPTLPGADPGIDTTAHSIRIAGPNRYQTAESIALMLRGNGTYPFGTPVNEAGTGWWGLATCPFSVIVTAGDTAADSLAAASLSDPTDQSSEPVLTRTASADPFFDPIGATARVDTDSAPIIVTGSTRVGATALAASARNAILDLTVGGCRTVRRAVIVGGTSAVPPGVDDELIRLGLDEVFRVAGDSRYGTAAAIATALGTGDAVTDPTCVDPAADDGTTTLGFYGNAAPEYRASATECQVLSRTVVLTDGVTGADALAAGWWTARWQVPILLVDGNGHVPTPTQDVLKSLLIDNVVILGGRDRVPDDTVAQVEALTGATVRRVSGANRYETAVQMAQTFGGWFPDRDGTNHDGSVVCLAASSGSGDAAVGWADALGAAPFCAAAGEGVNGGGTPAPERGLPPVTGVHGRVSRGLAPSQQAVPMLLTPAATPDLAPATAAFLGDVFDPVDVWCASTQADDTCLDPGFVLAFGGPAVLDQAAVLDAAVAASGRTYVSFADLDPAAGTAFWTALDLTPVFDTGGATGPDVRRVCVERGTLTGVRWLAVAGAANDLLLGGKFTDDGTNLPACAAFTPDGRATVDAAAVSVSGHRTPTEAFAIGDEHQLVLSDVIVQADPATAEGADAGSDGADGTKTHLVFTDGTIDGIAITSRNEPSALTSAGVDLDLQRPGTPGQPVSFTLDLTLTSSLGSVLATARGEAVFDGTGWDLRGRTTFAGGTWNVASGQGGFRARLDTGRANTADEVLTWQVDGLVSAG